MAGVPRSELAALHQELRSLPAVAPFLVRPGLTPGPRATLPTGLASLDALLGGGFPRGRVSEVVGARGSGRTSLLCATLAGETARGGLAAVVDATDALDPASARAFGVELGRLLWVRCGGSLRRAVEAADVVVRGGGFGLVLVDLGDLGSRTLARAPAATFVRLQRAVEGTSTALLFAGLRRVAGSMAALALALGPGRVRWAAGGPGLPVGLATEARVLRARDRAPGASVGLAWRIMEPAGDDARRSAIPAAPRIPVGAVAS